MIAPQKRGRFRLDADLQHVPGYLLNESTRGRLALGRGLAPPLNSASISSFKRTLDATLLMRCLLQLRVNGARWFVQSEDTNASCFYRESRTSP